MTRLWHPQGGEGDDSTAKSGRDGTSFPVDAVDAPQRAVSWRTCLHPVDGRLPRTRLASVVAPRQLMGCGIGDSTRSQPLRRHGRASLPREFRRSPPGTERAAVEWRDMGSGDPVLEGGDGWRLQPCGRLQLAPHLSHAGDVGDPRAQALRLWHGKRCPAQPVSVTTRVPRYVAARCACGRETGRPSRANGPTVCLLCCARTRLLGKRRTPDGDVRGRAGEVHIPIPQGAPNGHLPPPQPRSQLTDLLASPDPLELQSGVGPAHASTSPWRTRLGTCAPLDESRGTRCLVLGFTLVWVVGWEALLRWPGALPRSPATRGVTWLAVAAHVWALFSLLVLEVAGKQHLLSGTRGTCQLQKASGHAIVPRELLATPGRARTRLAPPHRIEEEPLKQPRGTAPAGAIAVDGGEYHRRFRRRTMPPPRPAGGPRRAPDLQWTDHAPAVGTEPGNYGAAAVTGGVPPPCAVWAGEPQPFVLTRRRETGRLAPAAAPQGGERASTP